MKPNNSVWVLKERVYRPQRDPAESVCHSHNCFKVHFNIIIPSTPRYHEVVCSFKEFRLNFVFILKSRMHAACPTVLTLPCSVHWNIFSVKLLLRS